MTLVADPPLPGFRPVLIAAALLIVSLIVVIGGWAGFARLDAAVISHGVVLAESRRKTVENLEGGILSRLLVAPGDRVSAGQPVAQLATVQDTETLTQLEQEHRALRFDLWRLAAEIDGSSTLDPATAPDTAGTARQNQIEQFGAGLRLLQGRVAALNEQVGLLSAQAATNDARADAVTRQIDSLRQDRATTAQLVRLGTAPESRLREIDRNLALLDGELAEFHGLATVARFDRDRIRAEIRSLDHQRVADATTKQAEAARKLPKLEAEIRATRDILDRRTLRAPESGVVIDIPVVSPGAVIRSGAVVMEILPETDALQISARLPPDAVDTVRPGKPARVTLTAFRQRLAPVIAGTVSYVSADQLTDPDGKSYFEARITLNPDDIAAQDLTLGAGMPVEVSIRTGERRAADYLLGPFLRHMGRAMREE
ncbi:MAG TPA: HlyD family type I secretion periplasmic adaptor subunit [Paenirhodobacter sp.]